MGALSHQLGFFTESTYGTGGTPTRFYEYNAESIQENEARTEGDPLISATFVKRNDRFTPWTQGASGNIQLDVMSKGFGYIFQRMLGSNQTTGPTETTVYTHTASVADLYGTYFSVQLNRPFHPAGTNQVMNYTGGKITDWTLSNAVDGNLVLDLGMDFQTMNTSTALAAAAYPTGMENLTWAGGVVTIGGTQVAITEFSLKGSNNLMVDRRFINGTTLKKEPTGGRRAYEFTIKCDFEDLTQRNRAHASTRSAALAQIVGTWTAPTILGSTIYPNLAVTLASCRFDQWSAFADSSTGGIEQELSGVVLYDGTNTPVKFAYQSADTTA